MSAWLAFLGSEAATWAVLVPAAFAVLVAALPRSEPSLVRALGLTGALVEGIILAALILGFDADGPTTQFAVLHPWLPGYGVNWSLAVDGTALPWLALVALVFPLALMTGGAPRAGEPPLVVGMLGLQSAWVAVLLAQDLILMVACWELAAVITIILIGERGDGRRGVAGRTGAARRYAAHALVGAAALIGAATLIGVAYANAHGGLWSWELADLARVTPTAKTQALGFGLVLVAVLAALPLVPGHTWLISLAVSGPTPVVATVLGASTAMGVFLLQRVALPLFPLAAGEWADPVAALAVIGAIYAAAVCWAEREPGRLLAHVALLHLALAVVGALSGSPGASAGLGLFLLAHGLGLTSLTAVLHGLRRSEVRNLGELAGWAAVAPRSATLGVFAVLILAGAPLTAGFVGELAIVVGVLRGGSLELLRPGLWCTGAILALGVGTLGVLVRLWQAGRGSPRPGLERRVADLSVRETLVGLASVILALGIGVGPAALVSRTAPAQEQAIDALHLARCLAIEARDSPRPRAREEFMAVCLDPEARIRQFYGLEPHAEPDDAEPKGSGEVEP